MKSAVPKVLHEVGGKPMLKYMLELLQQLKVARCIVVVGHQADMVKKVLKDAPGVKTVRQMKPLGSANAVWQTRTYFPNFRGNVLIIYGDTPLISYQSLKNLVRFHRMNKVACTILTAILKNSRGFGRIVRDNRSRIVKIIEEQDAVTSEKAIGEINVGVYCFKTKELFSALKKIKPDNVKQEYYLTDTIEVLSRNKARIGSICVKDGEEAFGVNSRLDLSRANAIINKRNIERLVCRGVTIIDPATTYLYGDQIEVGLDTIIYPHCYLEGKIKIGKMCHIGPFAHLRSGTTLEDGVEIGNFVEIVRSRVGSGSKIKHHSYIGDTTIGKGVNIGAGTIIANYDGKKKNHTFIGDGAFIGVGTILIAPVKIGKRAITGAGSLVTKNRDVPDGVTVVGVPARILKKKT